MDELYKEVLQHVHQLFETAGAKDPAHNVLHVEAVTQHVRQALVEENLDAKQQAAAILGALLHEADDAKLFPESDGSVNARRVLADCLPAALGAGALPGYGVDAAADLTDEVVEIIDRVSARKNKDAGVDKGKEWQLIVRDADRIEAIGEVGIARCFAYNTKVGAPLFVESTPRPVTEEDIWKIATPQRFAAYNGESTSMVDHYFDKLLHLQKCGSGNSYLERQFGARLQVMLDFVLEFGKKGDVDIGALQALQAKHCGSSRVPRGEKRRADSVPEPIAVGDQAGA
jgi:uncharacterized protein